MEDVCQIDDTTRRMLADYAAQYETADFLVGDPSWFMHQVSGAENQEATAFIASALSFGSRSQFMPKIEHLLDCANGDLAGWVRRGAFEESMKCDPSRCFYRFFTYGTFISYLRRYRSLMEKYGSLGGYVRANATGGLSAVESICRWFGGVVVPKDATSACKKVCMFLRWMVRTDSPVDLGLWADFLDRRTLVMPLDTHVLQQSCRLGLLKGTSASMSVARRLTRSLAEVFPDDPLKGDFALFGYGVNQKNAPHPAKTCP